MSAAPVRAGIVSAPHHRASEAGLAVLKDGGTAVEACVAAAATLAVVYPHMTGIGGDGFWLIREPDGALRAIDACGGAAAAASTSLYAGLDAIPWRGPLAANTVAGTVAGWALALAGDSGTLGVRRLLRDAIDLAHHGVTVTQGWAEIAAAKSAELACLPGAYATTFEPRGRPLRAGETLRQPALGETLSALAEQGLDAFYRGPLADRIAQDLAALGSPVSLADLRAYVAQGVTPLHAHIAGAHLFNMPPPTQGVASLLILALFDRIRAGIEGESAQHVHALVEATKQAFLWRNRHCGDPAAMSIDAQQLLDDPAALDAMAACIHPARAAPWPQPSAFGDTTWFGAADARGQVVSCIQSTYFEFGSGLILPQTGIAWQNRGSSFALSGRNALKPGRKPFHTLNPALAVLDDGRIMAYGTMGGEGQPQTQAAIFTRYALFDTPLAEAVAAPRWLLGRTWGEESTDLKLEAGFPTDVVEALHNAGHQLRIVPAVNAMMGHAGAIVRHADGRLEGASDPRSDGAVVAC